MTKQWRSGGLSVFGLRFGPLAVALTTILCATGALLTLPGPPADSAGRSYHVRPGGDDEQNGLSPETAWRTLTRASEAVLEPGDRLLIRAGASYRGPLVLGPEDAGDAEAPVRVGSYGEGRARIEAAGTAGVLLHNTAGVEIRDLEITGDAAAYADSGGIKMYSDLAGGGKLEHVVVSGVEVSGFNNGVEIGGGPGATGFRDVRVGDCELHHNKEAGLATYGPAFDASDPAYAHENVHVIRVEAHHNAGDPANSRRNTGSGIILGAVRDGSVKHSTAHHNGAESAADAPEGPEGIWTYDSTGVVIAHNAAYLNRSGGPTDGGGFGLDNNVSRSSLRYNLSFGNDGPGYLIYTSRKNAAHTGNVVAFNISSYDVRERPHPGYGGVTVAGRVHDLHVHHNTVVGNADGRNRAPALILGPGLSKVRVRNNVLVTDGAPLVKASAPRSPRAVLLQGNDYFVTDGPWALSWGSHDYGSLSAWRAATGQERLRGAATGMSADPRLTGGTEPLERVGDAEGFVPAADSPLPGAALPLRLLFGVDRGPVDHFGRPLGFVAAIGAAEPARSRQAP